MFYHYGHCLLVLCFCVTSFEGWYLFATVCHVLPAVTRCSKYLKCTMLEMMMLLGNGGHGSFYIKILLYPFFSRSNVYLLASGKLGDTLVLLDLHILPFSIHSTSSYSVHSLQHRLLLDYQYIHLQLSRF